MLTCLIDEVDDIEIETIKVCYGLHSTVVLAQELFLLLLIKLATSNDKELRTILPAQ